MLNGYERGLDLALRWQLRPRCASSSRRWRLSVYLFVVIPKGFFPQQDTGLIIGDVGGRAGHLVRRHEASTRRSSATIVLADPDVASVAMFIGGGGSALNTGRMFITLKPRDERDATRRPDHRAAAAEARQGRRRAALPAGRAGHPRRRPPVAHAVPVHPAGRRPRRAEHLGAARCSAKLQTLPQLRDVATDQQTEGTTLTLTIDRDAASRFGIPPQLIDDTLYDAFGQRQVPSISPSSTATT